MHCSLFHLNAYDEKDALDDEDVPFLLSKRKMLERYEESRRKVVNSEGACLMKILTKEAKSKLGSDHLKLANIDLHVGLIPLSDQQLLKPPPCVTNPEQLDIVSIIRMCGRSDVVRDDLFNTLISSCHNADRVLRVRGFSFSLRVILIQGLILF